MNSDTFLDSNSADDFLDEGVSNKKKDTLDTKALGDYAKKVGKSIVGLGEAGLNLAGGVGGMFVAPVGAGLLTAKDISEGNGGNELFNHYHKLLGMAGSTGTTLADASGLRTEAGDTLNEYASKAMENMLAMGPTHIPTAGALLPGTKAAVNSKVRQLLSNPDGAPTVSKNSLNDKLKALEEQPKVKADEFLDSPSTGGVGAFDKIAESQLSGWQEPVRKFTTPQEFLQDQLGKQKQTDTQTILDQRKAAMEQQVARAQGLDFNAAERARQEQAPTGYEAYRAQQEARLAQERDTANQVEMQRRSGMANETSQHELFDQPEMGRMANPYEAKLGDWRVDENGIPIKADLSMELANLGQPLQRNLWGDELQQTRNPVGQAANLFDVNGMQEGVPLTQAIDSMPWAQRRGAINSRLTGEMEASNGLKAAIAEANRRPMGSGDPKLGSQRGVINTAMFDELFKKVFTSKSGDWKFTVMGMGNNGAAILAEHKGEQAGILHLGKQTHNGTDYATADRVYVEPKFRGNNLSQKMYTVVKNMGNDVKASSVQTEAGKAMWESFRKAGLAEGDVIPTTSGKFIPKGQQGAVDFKSVGEEVKKLQDKFNSAVENLGKINLKTVATKTKEDYAKEIPGIGKATEGFILRPKPAEEAIPSLLQEKDGPPLIKSIQQGLESTAEKTRSGLMRFAADWLLHADKKTEYNYKTNVRPTELAISKLKDDMIPLAKVLMHEMFSEKRLTPEQLQGLGLKPSVIEARNMLRKNLDNLADLYDAGRARLGMEPLDRGEAYLAATRNGNYHLVIEGVGKDGNNYPAYHMQFTSVREAYKAISFFKESLKDSPSIDLKSLDKFTPTGPLSHWAAKDTGMYRESNAATNVPKDILGAYHEIAKLIDPESDAAAAIAEAIRQANAKAGFRVGTTKNRFMEKSNVRGFEGDMPWLSEKENAVRLINAQLGTIKEGMKWSYMQDALSNIKEVMANPELINKQPNNMAMVKHVMDNQLGLSKRVFKDAEDFVMHNVFGMSRGALREATQSLKGMTYLQQLGMSPGYVLGTSLSALNSVGMALRERGLGALSPTVIAKTFMDGSSGIIYDMYHEFGKGELAPPLTKIGKLALQYAEDNGLITKTLFSAGDERPNVGRIPGAIEKSYRATMSFPEKVSRIYPFMAFVHHLNDMGKHSDLQSLFKRAEELTNASQVNFRASERPTIVSTLGTMGNLGYVYKAPVFNYFHQLSAFSRDMVGGKDAGTKARGGMALMGMLGLTAYLGGALALPGVSEVDGGWNLIKEAWSHLDPETYGKVSGIGLKGSIIIKMSTNAAYGGVSAATGAQMSSRFTPNTVDVEHPLSGLAPVATELNEQTSLLKLAHNPSKRHLLEAVYVNSNPTIKGMLETNFDAFKSIKNAQGQQGYIKPSQVGGSGKLETDVFRTPGQETYRKLGLRELGEAKEKDNRYINSAEQQRVNTATEGNLDRMFTAIVDKNPMLINRYGKAAMGLRPDSAYLSKEIEKRVMTYGTTPEQRDAIRSNAIQTLLKIQRLKDARN